MKKLGAIFSWGLALLSLAIASAAQEPKALPLPDERYKADILLVVAHPDDEGAATPYLARALDEHKRIAVVFGTRGSSGANEGRGRASRGRSEPSARSKRATLSYRWALPTCGFSAARTRHRKTSCSRWRTGITVLHLSSWYASFA